MRPGYILTLILLALNTISCSSVTDKNPKPNIVFFFSDDHTTQAISAYGSTIATTPNIDRIAKEGMRFDYMLANNAICAPSRATILTGTYSHVNGVVDNHAIFDGSQPTLPKMLKPAGYESAIIGKWHLKSTPIGFDYFGVLKGQGEYFNPIWITPEGKGKREGYVSDIITDEALLWLNEKRTSDKPFMLMINHKAPHGNWEWHERYKDMYPVGSIPTPETFNDDFKTRTPPTRNNKIKIMTIGKTHLTRKPPKELKGAELKQWNYERYITDYLRTAQSVDDGVGQILDYLDKNGLTENTIIIYASDQGFFLGEHGWFDKRFPFEEALRMPFIMSYPKEIKPGTNSKALLGNHDILPTLLDYAGVTPPERVQGRSFRNLAAGGTPPEWTKSFYYRYYETHYWCDVQMEAIRTEKYKLINYVGEDAWELYDLEADPTEINNIYNNPNYSTTQKELTTKLTHLRQHYGVKN
jgi:arylsulfatase A-like enzyme